MVDISNVPRQDRTGAVVGRYYLKHVKVPGYSGVIGTVMFVDGRSTRVLSGLDVLRYVANIGRDIELEPADDESREALASMGVVGVLRCACGVALSPGAVLCAECNRAQIAKEEAANQTAVEAERAADAVVPVEPEAASPAVAEPAVDNSIDQIDDVEALRSIAAAHGVTVNEQWGVKRLRKEIRAAQSA